MNKNYPRKETLVGELMHIQLVGVTHALRKSKFPAVFLSRYIFHGATLCFTEVRAATLSFVSRLFSAHRTSFSRDF